MLLAERDFDALAGFGFDAFFEADKEHIIVAIHFFVLDSGEVYIAYAVAYLHFCHLIIELLIYSLNDILGIYKTEYFALAFYVINPRLYLLEVLLRIISEKIRPMESKHAAVKVCIRIVGKGRGVNVVCVPRCIGTVARCIKRSCFFNTRNTVYDLHRRIKIESAVSPVPDASFIKLTGNARKFIVRSKSKSAGGYKYLYRLFKAP